MPCHGNHSDLRRTLESIRRQEYPLIEALVIDEAATGDRGDPSPPPGDGVGWVHENGRAPFTIPPQDWSRGTGDVLAWVNAGDVWQPGVARVAVSHLLQRAEATVVHIGCAPGDATDEDALVHIFRSERIPGTSCTEELPRGLGIWVHRLRTVQAPPEHKGVASALADWFARETYLAQTQRP